MARQTKPGIDYFSHDVDMLQDKKIKIIKAKHGLMGYAIYIRLLEEVYRENGYYLQIDEDFNILFSDDNNIDYNVYILILNDCIEKGLFNKKMYDKHSILTSERIQSNYFSATERRKSVSFYKEYLIADPLQHYNIEKLNVYINSLNVNIGTQSKVKGKEKESKEDNIIIDKPKTTRFAPPTLEQVKEYCLERQNNVDPEKFIDFYESKGWVVGKTKMKSWKASVRTWEKSDNKKPNNKVDKFTNYEQRTGVDYEALANKAMQERINNG